MSDMNKLAAALRAAAAVLEGGEAVQQEVARAPSLADRIANFLRNDQSGFEYRSAAAIAKELTVTVGEVETAATSSDELETKRSTRGMGVLVSLA